MMEFKIQVSFNGKDWEDSCYNIDSLLRTNYKDVKSMIDCARAANPNFKYRIVGHELMPWCEIKESEVKYGD